MHSVVIIRPATEAAYCSAERVTLVGSVDTEVDHVAVFFSCCVVTVVTVACFHVVCHNRRLFTGVGNDLTQRRFHCAQRNFDTDVLIFVLTGQASEFRRNANQRYAAASHHAFFNRSTGCVQGVVDACFFLFHFNFGSRTDFDYCHAASQFSDTFLQFFTIVVGGRFFDLLTDLSYAALDCGFFANAIDDGGGVFVDNHAFRPPSLPESLFPAPYRSLQR